MTVIPDVSGGSGVTGVLGLALQVGRTPAADLDLGAMLSGVCASLPAALGVSGAVIVLAEPPDPVSGAVFGSDEASARLGLLQHRAGSGPVLGALRSGRAMVTPDLTRIGPPELAAAAADAGLVVSVAVPLALDGHVIGGLQLLGHPGVRMDSHLADELSPLVEALSARLADVRELSRCRAAAARSTAGRERSAPVEQAMGMLAERYRTDIEEAGRYLRSQAGNTGRELAEMAAAVIERRDGDGAVAPTVPGPREGGPGERVEPAPPAGTGGHRRAVRPADEAPPEDLRAREDRFREARSRGAEPRRPRDTRAEGRPGPHSTLPAQPGPAQPGTVRPLPAEARAAGAPPQPRSGEASATAQTQAITVRRPGGGPEVPPGPRLPQGSLVPPASDFPELLPRALGEPHPAEPWPDLARGRPAPRPHEGLAEPGPGTAAPGARPRARHRRDDD
ncbi:ANTAR domain-containing protein [Pseudonocardia sp. T1-2H]|uniref:ANTAR domain-containing protein n=1 Tax=Pseudonocardia sp. T1-2H TaxID=3128899 RepID=UPI00310151DF